MVVIVLQLWAYGEIISLNPRQKPTHSYPKTKDLTMHLAEAAKIKVVPHSLIRLSDGKLGYITKRIDRTKKWGEDRYGGYVSIDITPYRI